tara:strand:+ start:891 stop:1103 length:213 start_codon:yes stop_codon:yes gene_type:complete
MNVDTSDILMELDSLNWDIKEWQRLIKEALKSKDELSNSTKRKIKQEIRNKSMMFMFKHYDNLKEILRDV